MENKQDYIQRAADWAQASGFTEVRANASGYEKPITYNRQQDSQSFTPDVTGKQFDQKSYFDVLVSTADRQQVISRLKLLSQLAAVRGGHLYVMVPKGHQPFAKNIVAECQVAAEVINLL